MKLIIATTVTCLALATAAWGTTSSEIETARTEANEAVQYVVINSYPSGPESIKKVVEESEISSNNVFDKKLSIAIGSFSSTSSELTTVKTELSSTKSKVSTSETKISELESKVKTLEKENKEMGESLIVIKNILKI